MNTKSAVSVLALTSLLAFLPSCAGERPFLIVQMCLRDQHNVSQFMAVMKSIAHTEHMKFFDGGAATQKDLTTLNSNPPYRLIYFGAMREDGVGMEAGNLGLSAYEIAIGFSNGSNPRNARRFANMVVDVLKRRWLVYIVPEGQGALPMCKKL